jgi:outer membrane lipoprotein-sorting protein
MTMKRSVLLLSVPVFLLTLVLFSQPAYGRRKQKVAPKATEQVAKAVAPTPAPAAAVPAPSAAAPASLDKVLAQMDQQAANFKNAQANFVWDQYTKVVDDHDLQEGTIYFRRQQKNDIQMAADITKANSQPIAKVVLFTDGMVRLYEPKIDRVTEYDAGKNKSDFESFLVLGFGGGGRDLLKSFDVKYQGTEQVQGVNAAKLDLTPKSKKVSAMFNRIILWIDPARGVSVQQQFFNPDGDFRIAKYNNIRINEKINDDVFKLKTTSHTTTVRPNS